MLRTERMDNPVAAGRAMLSGWQAGIWTAMPAILQTYENGRVTCSVQPAIELVQRAPDGTTSPLRLPVLVDCPVVFPSGGGYGLFLPLEQGDEGLVVFSARCIDAWWQSGGVQPQAELRLHDLSDGFFIPGVFSQARKPSAPLPTGAAQLRSLDGQVQVEVGSQQVTVTPDGGSTSLQIVPGTVTIKGNLNVTGSVIGGFGGGDQVGLQTHNHHGVSTGNSNTQPPNPGT